MVCTAQDFFETRLLSMDTDFRVLSSDYLGSLPGIDIAQVCLPLTGLHGRCCSTCLSGILCPAAQCSTE